MMVRYHDSQHQLELETAKTASTRSENVERADHRIAQSWRELMDIIILINSYENSANNNLITKLQETTV